MSQDLEARLKFAVDIAKQAGELGMKYFREVDKLTVESKGHQDLVSNADRELELFIRAAINEAYPGDGIVGEEHAPVASSTGYDWVLDPIDGTANFVRGIPAWTVVIACTKDGRTVVGAVHEPSSGETFHGRKGGGAFVNGKTMRASPATRMTEGSIGIGFSNRVEAAKVLPLMRDIMAEGGVFFRNASGALMLAYVAAGRLLGYAEEHMNAWDCLAALLLVEEAGGTIVEPDPATVLQDGTLVICAGKGIFPKLRQFSLDAFKL